MAIRVVTHMSLWQGTLLLAGWLVLWHAFAASFLVPSEGPFLHSVFQKAGFP